MGIFFINVTKFFTPAVLRMSTAILLFFNFQAVYSQQYILNGSAQQINCYCYQLTDGVSAFQNGSVWNANKIDLNNPFDFSFNVFCGCKDADGADGIVFMLQPISTSIGTPGEGMGFQGVVPSIGITLDTYQNTNRSDPPYDHISIQANGIIDHTNDLAGPVPVSAFSDNVEDCLFRTLRISWDPLTKWLRTYFDGQLRLEVQKDLIVDIFSGNPLVFWGFSAATGGLLNRQLFCTALNPAFTTNGEDAEGCANVAVSFQNESTSFGPIQSFYWDFGDSTTSNLPNPVHTYTRGGNYQVKFVITGFDGCVSDTLKRVVNIGEKPMASFIVSDTCIGIPLRIDNQSVQSFDPIELYTWTLDGTPVGAERVPDIRLNTPGPSLLTLSVTSKYGCKSDAFTVPVSALPSPIIDATFENGCNGDTIIFTAQQNDQSTTIAQWKWSFPDGGTYDGMVAKKHFPTGGYYNVTLYGIATNGCYSDVLTKQVLINEVRADAGNDTIVLKNMMFQLKATATVVDAQIPSFLWEPAQYFVNPTIADPKLSLSEDQKFTLTVSSGDGCVDTSSVFISVFDGSSVFVPTAFTPNNDGLNDFLKPYLIGIAHLAYFNVYNRLGQLVYSSNSVNSEGWNGFFNGVKQDGGTYVWFLKAVDLIGKEYNLKGTVSILR
jgi:gliding motility-associated-like protein